VGNIEAEDVLGGRSQCVAGIRRPAPIEIPKAQQRPPLRVVRIDQDQAGRDQLGVVVSAVADRSAAKPVASIINAVIVAAVIDLAGLLELAARAREFGKGLRRPAIEQVACPFDAELAHIATREAARFVLAYELTVKSEL